MKLLKLDEKRVFRDILLVITILAGFIFIVSFASYYVSDVIKQGMACSCIVPIPIMILLLSSLGVFVGSLSYYLLSSKFVKERQEYSKDINSTLRFLDYEERKIIEIVINNKGNINQSKLVEKTNLNKVKVSRLIKKLIEKNIITKKGVGKINKIYIHGELEKLFK